MTVVKKANLTSMSLNVLSAGALTVYTLLQKAGEAYGALTAAVICATVAMCIVSACRMRNQNNRQLSQKSAAHLALTLVSALLIYLVNQPQS